MQDVIIRRATLADVETLRSFEQGVVTAERPYDVTLRPTAVQYYPIDSMVVDQNVCFVIAQLGAVMVGCGFARIDDAKLIVQHAVQGYLGLMYVDPVYRGLGINGRIIDSLKTWCRDRDVSELRLEVYEENKGAIRAYAKAGFVPFMLEMRMDLN